MAEFLDDFLQSESDYCGSLRALKSVFLKPCVSREKIKRRMRATDTSALAQCLEQIRYLVVKNESFLTQL